MDFKIEISVLFYVGNDVSKLIFDIFWKIMIFDIEISIFDIKIIKHYMI